MFMADEKNVKVSDTIYLSLSRNAVVVNYSVCIKDIAEVCCERKDIQRQVQNLVVERVHPKEAKVLSSLFVIECIQKEFPGKVIQSVGEKDVIISVKQERAGKIGQAFKVIFVSLVLFFGTAFTIMAFHGDIGIEKMFGTIYEQMTGRISDGVTILEVSYTLGIVVGILVFFNHVRGKKVSPQPTPVQVKMREYEMKMDQAFIENVSRNGTEENVK